MFKGLKMNEKNLSLQLPIANNDTALYTKKITPLCTLLVKGNFMSMRLFYSHLLSRNLGFPGGSVVKNPSANPGDTGSIPGSGGSPVGGHGNPLQHSCLGNPTKRGIWRAIVHGVAKSQT